MYVRGGESVFVYMNEKCICQQAYEMSMCILIFSSNF